MMKLRVGQCTSIGNYRDNNEDRLYVDANRQLFLVADGMGGQAAGEQASQIAAEMIPRRLVATVAVDDTDPERIREAMSVAVAAASEAIIAQGIADPSIQNMGTTVVMCVLRGNQLYVANLGDSPAFLFRDGHLKTLTKDHNLAQALVDTGAITEEEAKTHRFRHVLWKYLGSKENHDGPDIVQLEVQVGDRILMCSDGLTGVVLNDVIEQQFIRFKEPQKLVDHLVHLALESGSKDNVTCVAVFIDAM
jgi:PPM family protein phosphatase